MLLDANLLVYAKMREMPQHEAARSWLEEQINGPTRLGMPWPTLIAFLRIVTHPRLFDPPLPTDRAWAQVHDWLSIPGVWLPWPTDRHADVLGRLLAETAAVGNVIHDAHLAALATEHGLVVYSTDGDFARFPGVRWTNPLLA